MKRYLLKVDISGIQDFIFNVPSKGASRNLKARSFFVQGLTEIAEQYFIDIADETEELYNGGGNLFIYLRVAQDVLDSAISKFQNCFLQEAIFPFIAYIEAEHDDAFYTQMQALHTKISLKKLVRPFLSETFQPMDASIFDERFRMFAKKMVKAQGYSIVKSDSNELNLSIEENQFKIAGYILRLEYGNQAQKSFSGTIINAMPLDDENNQEKGILEFDKIAEKAKSSRKVDDKLAALKIDVDNLGVLFRNKSKNEYKQLSYELKKFFSNTIYSILKKEIQDGNIYPVFSGGDDCFLIGAWDIILQVAQKIHHEFDAFQSTLCKTFGLEHPLTISAGIVIYNPKFPMARVGQTAEHALELAKDFGKNRICIFGEVLKWNEFENAGQLAIKLKELIEDGESRGILERIRSSEIGFLSLQERAIKAHRIDFPKVYRLKYYLRNVKNSKNKEILENEFKKYEDALLEDFIHGRKESNAAQFPVAARWAELLTKSVNT